MRLISIKVLLILIFVTQLVILATWYFFVAKLHLRYDAENFDHIVSPIAGLLAFGGLVFTIILQLNAAITQRIQEKVRIYAKMLDDVTGDLHTLEMGSYKGVMLMHHLQVMSISTLSVNSNYQPYIEFLSNVNMILLDVRKKVITNVDRMPKGDLEILNRKILYVYNAYLKNLEWKVISDKTPSQYTGYNFLRTTSGQLQKELLVILGEKN